MRIAVLILFLSYFQTSIAQRVPISAYTYENCTAIDNYFGETDSLIRRYNIQTVNVYSIEDKKVLYRIENYQEGKRTMVIEFDFKSGKPDRMIQYTHGDNVLNAEIIHYPSADNFNIFPSKKHSYLIRREDSNEIRSLYKKDDTVTYIVRMHIRHTFRDDGTILFEGFNKDGSLVESHLMKPIVSWEEYQQRKRTKFPATVVDGPEEYRYDEKGRLVLYNNKDLDTQRVYKYDKRGLLEEVEVLVRGQSVWTTTYEYQ